MDLIAVRAGCTFTGSNIDMYESIFFWLVLFFVFDIFREDIDLLISIVQASRTVSSMGTAELWRPHIF